MLPAHHAWTTPNVPTPTMRSPTAVMFSAVLLCGRAHMRAHAAAMLMSPLPVLAQTMRHQLQQTALQSVQAATNLLDLSMSEAEMPMQLEQVPEMPTFDDPPSSMGPAAMVGAAAAALVNLRH